MTQKNNEKDIETWYGREARSVAYRTGVVTREKWCRRSKFVVDGLGGARIVCHVDPGDVLTPILH